MIPKPKIVTQPSQLAVSLDEVKLTLRIDQNDEDKLITSLIKSATLRLEQLCNRKFVTQTWDIFYDCFGSSQKDIWWDGTREMPISELNTPSKKIELPFGPMQSVTGVYTYDEADTEIVFPSSNYTADLVGAVGSINLKLGAVWPTTVLRPANGIKVRAVFGYGQGHVNDTSPSVVPLDIQDAISHFTAYLYEHRGDELPKIPANVSMLIEPYRSYKVGG